MNFVSNVLNSIPVVGHVKGIVHIVAGDTEGGKQAMYQATRTSAVLGGGAVGCLAGPGGAVIGAMYGGLAADGVASVAMNEPQGIVKGCENIANDVIKGKNPTGSILSTGFQIGMDGVGGLGMGGVSSAASQVSEKAVAKTVENVAKKAVATVGEKAIQKTAKVTGEEVVKIVTKKVSEKAVKKAIETAAIQAEVALVASHVAMQAKKTQKEETDRRDEEDRNRQDRERRDRERERQDRERRDRERERQDRERRDREREQQDRERRDREQREKQADSATGSGPPQPPRGNKNNNKSGQVQVDFFAIFKDMLAKLLKRIFGNEKPRTRTDISDIFTSLSRGQIDHFSTIIERLMNCNILEEVLTIVIQIFSEHFPKNISFPNFLSFLEFVAVYITEEVSNRIVRYRMSKTISRRNDRSIPQMEPDVLESTILSELTNLENIVQIIIDLFRKLQFDIGSEIASNPISPAFRDIYSAVYHYFKHRCVPGDGILSIKEYFDWIRRLQQELGQNETYREWLQRQRTGNVNGTVVGDLYVHTYGRRIRIVVKFRHRSNVLSSCMFLDIIFKGDKEGDDIIIRFYP